MKNGVLVTTLYTNQHKHTVRQNHSNVLSEYIQTNNMLQTMCTDSATVNHTLTKLRQPQPMTNLMHKFLIHLLQFSTCTCFEQYLAHPREVKLYINTASGIVTVSK
jgi:hypothetical protein